MLSATLPLARRYAISIALMLIVTTIFGGYSILAHRALAGAGATLHPLVFALARDSIGTALLLGGLYLESRGGGAAGKPRAPLLPARADIPQLLLCGVCGVWCSQAGSAIALRNLDAVTMSLLQPLLPLVTAVASLAAGYEAWPLAAPASWAKALGLATAVGGGGGGGGGSFAVGLLFVGIQVAGGGLYSICQKPLLLAGHSPLFVAAHGYVLGWCILVLCALSGCTAAADWAWTPAAALAAAYSGVLSSAFNYWAMAVCVHLSGPLFAAAFFPFMPVATVLLSWAAGGGLPAAQEALGGLLCAGGLGLFVVGKFREGAGAGAGEGEGEGEGEGQGESGGKVPLLPAGSSVEIN